MTFTANAGVLAGDRFIPSNFRFPERQPEEDHFVRWFRAHGYRIEPVASPPLLGRRGGRAARRRCDLRGLPLPQRSSAASTTWRRRSVRNWCGWSWPTSASTTSIPASRRWAGGRPLYEPAGFSREARARLAEHFDDLIAVDHGEALRFACNALVVGKQVVLNSGCPKTARALAERGYEAIATPTDEFIKAGGSVKCLALMLDAFPPAAGPDGQDGQNLARSASAERPR